MTGEPFDDSALFALHAELVAIPSVSREEGPIADFVVARLAREGVAAERVGHNVFALHGPAGAPILAFNTHLDTVPASPAWTRPPHEPQTEHGRVYGLGSNDAKASAAAMTAAFLRLRARSEPLPVRILLALSAQEELGGRGSEVLVPELVARGLRPAAAVIGEPTGLDIAVAQKGLLVCELTAEGTACHAAHGRALGARNAIRELARDLLALEDLDLGSDEWLGPVTIEPTMLNAGTARNMVPGEATCLLDVRTNPAPNQRETAERLAAAVRGRLHVVSERLRPCAIDAAHPLVRAARRARPGATTFGSRGLSDLVFFHAAGVPAIKVGPGRTERSHTPDEFVDAGEILDGAAFYERLAVRWAEEHA